MRSARCKPEERCEHCGERLTRRRVSVYRHRGRRHVLFQRVPALVCRACGQRVFDPAAVEAMELTLNQRGAAERTAPLVIVPS
jgi:YgiT-type zinc finger domain-containing protein